MIFLLAIILLRIKYLSKKKQFAKTKNIPIHIWKEIVFIRINLVMQLQSVKLISTN